MKLDNTQLASKVEALNNKPKIRKDAAAHLMKLSQAQSIKDINHTKLDIQKRIGDTELEN